MNSSVVSECDLDWFTQTRSGLEVHLERSIRDLVSVEPTLREAMAYSLLDGGKRLRASLVFATGYAVGVSVEKLLPVAAAIEAVHAYSLVHDDMPCMDNDVLRRGKPTCHVKFGQAMALLTGDALQTLAFQWLSDNQKLEVSSRLKQVQALAKASGAEGMANGQAIDLQNVGQSMSIDELKNMHARKTGDLVLASVRLGYLACENLEDDKKQALEEYAKALGLAYQVLDDILDVESSSEQLGKTSGKDAAANKPTIVSLLGLEEAKRLLEQLRLTAVNACDRLASDRNRYLKDLIHLIVERKS